MNELRRPGTLGRGRRASEAAASVVTIQALTGGSRTELLLRTCQEVV